MKKLLLTSLILGVLFISCEKELIEPISFNHNLLDTIGVFDGPEAEFPIEDSDSTIRVIDTFEGWGCDTFTTSPTMSAIGIFCGGGANNNCRNIRLRNKLFGYVRRWYLAKFE